MIPRSSGASIPVAARASPSRARVARISLSVATIGSIALTGCSAATRRTRAAAWRGSRGAGAPGGCRARPGTGGPAAWQRGSGLSAPASSVRTTSGRLQRAGELAQRLGLLVLVGQLRAVEEEELGAQQAHPLAPSSTASPASAAEPRLAKTSTDAPSRIAPGSRARSSAAACRAAARSRRSCAAASSSAPGRPERPRVAVEQQRRALADRQQRCRQAHGRRQAQRAARIAACAVAEPLAVAIRVRARSRPAVSAGGSSPARK